VWYQDTFDRETPFMVDAKGRGLIGGLRELWARHMCETVTRRGFTGFSRFWLRWDDQTSVRIGSSREGATRLREWLFGDRSAKYGYVRAADARLLDLVAHAHACLIAAGRSADEILAAAAEATDRPSFCARLDGLIEELG
jgi:hypothetical protein